MTPAEPSVTMSRSAAVYEPAARGDAVEVRADSLPVRVAAALVLCTAVASIVWYCVDAVLAL